jgi:hypothetical protein
MGFLPGMLMPGEPGEALEGICGEEKLLLPRLPMDRPPPALAQALDSMKVAIPKKNRVENTSIQGFLPIIVTILSSLVFMFQLWSIPSDSLLLAPTAKKSLQEAAPPPAWTRGRNE